MRVDEHIVVFGLAHGRVHGGLEQGHHSPSGEKPFLAVRQRLGWPTRPFEHSVVLRRGDGVATWDRVRCQS